MQNHATGSACVPSFAGPQPQQDSGLWARASRHVALPLRSVYGRSPHTVACPEFVHSGCRQCSKWHMSSGIPCPLRRPGRAGWIPLPQRKRPRREDLPVARVTSALNTGLRHEPARRPRHTWPLSTRTIPDASSILSFPAASGMMTGETREIY